MGIFSASGAPEAGFHIVENALRDLEPKVADLGSGRVEISDPMALFRLGIDEIYGLDSLEHAHFVGWRYLLEGGDQPIGMADIGQSDTGDLRFSNLARNEQADLLLGAAHLAAEVAARQDGDCEARILIVPSLYVSALWLTTSPPIFIPIVDAAHPIRQSFDLAVKSDFMIDLIRRAETARTLRTISEPSQPFSAGR